MALLRWRPQAVAAYAAIFVAGVYALGIDLADVGVMAQDETASIIKDKLGYFILPGSTKVWNIKTESWVNSTSLNQHAPYLGWGG